MDAMSGTYTRGERNLWDAPSFARVLAIGAHPDDVEIGAGGLLARLARAGRRVAIAVASSPNEPLERLQEARAAAQIVGAELHVLFGGEPMRVEDLPMHRMVRRLDELIAAERPELVLTHSERDLHWDHRLIHHATISALRRTPCHLLCFTSTPELNAASSYVGPAFADITPTIDIKLAAVAAHASQIVRGSVNLDGCRDLARALGRLSGVTYAEAYEVLRLRL
jgi:LmbE family N-acetylglucosaminyl deacetylase